MVQLAQKLLTTEEFIANYGDTPQYELIDGELIDLEPTGAHEQVIAMIARKLNVVIDREDMAYIIPHRCLIKLLGTTTAFRPDLIVLNQNQLHLEPLWQQEPVICIGKAIALVVEVVSSNWQNDYARKSEDYAQLGIPEYWIVDYLGLGGREFIGTPKQPTLTICTLQGDRYQRQLFRSGETLQSPTFPSLELTAAKVFTAGKPFSSL